MSPRHRIRMARLAWLAAAAPIIVVAVAPKQGGEERGGVDVNPTGDIVIVPPSPIKTHVEGKRLRGKRKRPNILLLLADDLGYGELEGFSPYPGVGDAVTGTTVSDRTIHTPELSRLRSEGVSMANFYAGEAVCAPSRCALFTGKHTGHATVRGNAKGPDGYDFPLRETPDDLTLAELLSGAGYDTAMVGKWCFGGPESRSSPWLKGFDRFFGHLNQAAAHNMYPRYLWERWGSDDADEEGEGGASKVLYPENINATRDRCMRKNSTCRYSHSLFVERALDFLDEHHVNKWNSDESGHSDGDGSSAAEGTAAASADHQRPFFLFVSFTVPHAGGWTGEGIRGSFPERGNPVPSDGRYADRTDWPDVERDHASSITEYLDRDVGRILSKLDELDVAEDTLVIFTSDNGPHNEGGHDVNFFDSAGPLRGYKRSLYEGGIRVPFVARWPGGGIDGGRTTDEVAWFPDLMATFAEAAGVDDGLVPDDTDGYSILGLLTGGDDGLDDGATNKPPTPPEDRVLYWEFCTGGMWGQAVRRRAMKLISLDRPNSPWELYNLTADPGESNCVAGRNPDVVTALEREAENAHVDDPNWPTGRGCRGSDSFELSVSFALHFS